MSKDQKKRISIPVETVENLDFMLSWITSSITFFNLNKCYPGNLIQYTVDEMIRMIKPYWIDPLEENK